MAKIADITIRATDIPEVRRMLDDLRRFVKKVADCSQDDDLAIEAEGLVVLYGHPDGLGPTGVIDATADRVHPS